ncbi:MAG: hypothetical protein VKI81_04745, partial [Synechococcaceae cyanobacterium]|nr:hypothetical protein [Synechococcaceae cyanobacterium]
MLAAAAGRGIPPGAGALLLGILLLLTGLPAGARPQPATLASLDGCLGDRRSLILSGSLPYTPVRVQEATGFFLIDFGSDGSVISPGTFLGGRRPVPMDGTTDRFERVDFFGPTGPLRLGVQDHRGIRSLVPQAGIIGTDLMAGHVVTLDVGRALVHRASRESFCDDDALRRAGFVPLSTRTYYAHDPATLTCPAAPRGTGCPNIPSLPLRIGTVEAVAQMDTGYDDRLHPFSINVNRAFMARLRSAG